jgi:C1A family cysteine protease
MIKRKWGWTRDLPDHRDKLYRVEADSEIQAITTLPTSVNLRPKMPPVYDQGQLGSCVSNAISGNLQFIHPDIGVPSRLFIYYNMRVMENSVKYDSGAQVRDGIKSVASLGVCTESLWPYNINKFKSKPWCWCYKQAKKDIFRVYLKVKGLQEMKTCLAAGFPFVFGFTCYDAFESDEVSRTGILNYPGPNESVVGGHSVLCCGFDDATQRVTVRNSYGPDWGQEGYFSMPYSYIDNPQLTNDCWTVRGQTPGLGYIPIIELAAAVAMIVNKLMPSRKEEAIIELQKLEQLLGRALKENNDEQAALIMKRMEMDREKFPSI